jgi:DNA-binding SARP family transcriptional activator
MRRSLLTRVRAAIALGLCVVALTAIPLVLTRWGGLPTTAAVRNAITLRYLPAHLAIGLAAAATWIAYAYLLARLATEIAYGLTRRSVTRRPRSAWAHILTARLATLAFVVAGRVAIPAAAPAAVQTPAALTIPLAPELAVAHVELSADQHHIVVAGDNLWDLAEDYYGDGFAWRRIWSANPAAVPDPRELSIGQTLVIPGPDGTGRVSATYTVHRGDSLWSIAQNRLGSGQEWPALWAANRQRPEPGGATLDDPSLIRPGWGIDVPAPAAETPSTATLAAPTSPVAPTAPPRATTPPLAPPSRIAPPPAAAPASPPETLRTAPFSTSPLTTVASAPPPSVEERPVPTSGRPAVPDGALHDGQAASEPTPVGLLGAAGTLLAVGISSAVWRRRRRRQLRLPPGTRPPVPPPDLDDLRAEVAAGADTDHTARLRAALGEMADALAARRSEARPRLVQVAASRVEALLSQPALPAPTGWRPEASGSVWVLDGEPNARNDAGGSPCPAMVSIGCPEDGAQLYLDLEAEGILAICGERTAAHDVARAWALELATSPLADSVSIAVVGGDLLADSDTWERVRRADTWEEIAGDAVAWVEQATALLAANRWPTPVAGRRRAKRQDDLAPLVVIVDGKPTDERFDPLCQAVLAGALPVALVLVGEPVEGATRVEVDGSVLHIPSLGLSCPAQAVSGAAAGKMTELMEDASRPPTPLELIPEPQPPPSVIAGTSSGTYEDPDYEILVRLLGEIYVVGGAKTLKPKQTAVLAYIALHGPVSSDAVEDAVWVAPTASRRKRLANTVSECRTALGAAHLPVAADGRYRVGRTVVTDLELFDRRVAFAAQRDDPEAIDALRGALELVEGPVFTYRSTERASYVWVDVGNWHTTWELKVTDAAEDLAQRCIDHGDLDGAVWAAQRGLHTSTTHPRLTKLLIRSYFAKGDPRAATQVFESHQAALHELDLDDVDPELVDFYEQARHNQSAAAS